MCLLPQQTLSERRWCCLQRQARLGCDRGASHRPQGTRKDCDSVNQRGSGAGAHRHAVQPPSPMTARLSASTGPRNESSLATVAASDATGLVELSPPSSSGRPVALRRSPAVDHTVSSWPRYLVMWGLAMQSRRVLLQMMPPGLPVAQVQLARQQWQRQQQRQQKQLQQQQRRQLRQATAEV